MVNYVVDNTNCENRLLKSSLLYKKIGEKIKLAIRIARNSALRDGVDSLTKEINYSISAIEGKGLSSKGEEIIDHILRLLGKIELSWEYCIRAHYGLGDTRYNLQVGITQTLQKITKADPRLSGGGVQRENIRQHIRRGFRSLVNVYIHNPN